MIWTIELICRQCFEIFSLINHMLITQNNHRIIGSRHCFTMAELQPRAHMFHIIQHIFFSLFMNETKKRQWNKQNIIIYMKNTFKFFKSWNVYAQRLIWRLTFKNSVTWSAWKVMHRQKLFRVHNSSYIFCQMAISWIKSAIKNRNTTKLHFETENR